MRWLFLVLFLPTLISVGYVHSDYGRLAITACLVALNFSAANTVGIANMTSLLEVAIGVNLALSFLASFSQFIGKVFERAVHEFDPKENPTFLEAMKESAVSNGKELGSELNVLPLQSKYIDHVQQQIADFNKDAMEGARLMKMLGVYTALGGVVLLMGAAMYATLTFPHAIFWLIIVALVLPIATHILILLYQYAQYSLSIRAFGNVNGNGAVYKAFIQDSHKIYKTKKRMNARVDLKVNVDVLR